MTFVVEKATSVPVQRPLYLKAGLRNGRWDGRTWWVPDIDEAFRPQDDQRRLPHQGGDGVTKGIRSAETVYVVQHADNPTMFFTDDASTWSTAINDARRYRTSFFALRAVTNKLNGRGHVLPMLVRRRIAA